MFWFQLRANQKSATNNFYQDKVLHILTTFIPLHVKFLQFNCLRAVVFQLNLKYLHVKITNLLQVVV